MSMEPKAMKLSEEILKFHGPDYVDISKRVAALEAELEALMIHNQEVEVELIRLREGKARLREALSDCKETLRTILHDAKMHGWLTDGNIERCSNSWNVAEAALKEDSQ